MDSGVPGRVVMGPQDTIDTVVSYQIRHPSPTWTSADRVKVLGNFSFQSKFTITSLTGNGTSLFLRLHQKEIGLKLSKLAKSIIFLWYGGSLWKNIVFVNRYQIRTWTSISVVWESFDYSTKNLFYWSYKKFHMEVHPFSCPC